FGVVRPRARAPRSRAVAPEGPGRSCQDARGGVGGPARAGGAFRPAAAGEVGAGEVSGCSDTCLRVVRRQRGRARLCPADDVCFRRGQDGRRGPPYRGRRGHVGVRQLATHPGGARSGSVC
ncbi:unnamed protein product, partial [Scytosiphon promiscuus]